MSFNPTNMVLWSASRIPEPPVSLPQWWGYLTTDTMATVTTAGYFNADPTLIIDFSTIRMNDFIYCACSDGIIQVQVNALSPNVTVTLPSADIAPGTITTAMLGANIVTAAKIANGTITTTQISGTAGITGAQLAAGANIAGSQLAAAAGITGGQIAATTITGANLVANTIATAQLDPTTVQYVKVPMTLANFTGMYATPFQLIAAPSAGQMIVLERMVLDWVFGSAALTAGGAVTVQLGNAAHAAGVIVSGSIAAADLTGLAASSAEMANGLLAITANTSLTAVGLFLSNATQAFATGTGGSANVHCWYRIVTL